MYHSSMYRSAEKQKAAVTRNTARHRAWLNEQKSKPCMDCGGIFPPCAMDFDHRNPEEKMGTIHDLRHRARRVIEAEIEKCDVVCANCHRIRTHTRMENLRK